jgi:N-acetylmuramoyl-L-alanine amidase
MFRLFLFVFFLVVSALPAGATVEIVLNDEAPVTIDEVYLREGVPYLPAQEVLEAFHLSGQWDSVEHVYKIRTSRGTAVISPGSHFLRLGERFVPLAHPPQFIDGRLRISEDIVSSRLPALLGLSVRYRNLDPPAATAGKAQTPLDKLFSFFLRKKTEGGAALRGIALDPGHGGQDTGSLGIGGVKEKEVALGVARRLEKLVKMQLGIPVYLSRDGDYALDRRRRLEIVANPEVDALILLHAQASFSPAPRGVTFFVRPEEVFEGQTPPAGEGESMRLAQLLAGACKENGLEVAGIVKAPLLPLGRGDLPTVLAELGYLSNAADQALLRDPSGQEALASALFNGLKKFADERKETRK